MKNDVHDVDRSLLWRSVLSVYVMRGRIEAILSALHTALAAATAARTVRDIQSMDFHEL